MMHGGGHRKRGPFPADAHVPMRAILLYNAKAGTATSKVEVVQGLRKLGWRVDVCEDIEGVDDALEDGAEVVVAAGGDGTVATVAKRLAGTAVPMAIIPMGTANNVARSLGLGSDPRAAVAGLANPTTRHVDMGCVSTGKTHEYVLEGIGVGLFAYVLASTRRRSTRSRGWRSASWPTSSSTTIRFTSTSRSMAATSPGSTCWPRS